jgi:hypothetical protein
MSDDSSVTLNNAYFDDETAFYLDNNLWDFIVSFLPKDENVCQQFRQDLEWFQHEHVRGKRSQLFGNTEKDNIILIRQFEDYISNKEYARHLDMPLIMAKIRERYL